MEIKSITTLFKKYYKLEEIILEHNGKTIIRERLDKKSAVAAVVYNTETQKYIFVKQWRPGVLGDIVELCAGTLDKPGENPEDCMMREVEEEVGYKVDYIELLIPEFYLSPGYTNEKMIIYYCEVSVKLNEGGGCEEENENIEVIEIHENDLEKEFLSGKFIDSKTIMGIQAWFGSFKF